MKPTHELKEDFPPFKKGDLLRVTHRTTIYSNTTCAFDHPTENKIVHIPIEKLKGIG